MQSIQKSFYAVIRFLREVKIEMKRVNWLSKREVLNYTVLVVSISIVVGIYLGGLDFILTWILSNFIL